MKATSSIVALFWIAAAYDGLLGLVFLLAPQVPFDYFGVVPPNHVGYVQFPAALLIVFGLMFARIASDPVAGRALIPYGILLKIAYCGVAFYHWLSSGIPGMWKPFAVADLAFIALFVWAWNRLGPAAA